MKSPYALAFEHPCHGSQRGELLSLRLASIQLREDHWVIADLSGKGGHIRTVPIPLNRETVEKIKNAAMPVRVEDSSSVPDATLNRLGFGHHLALDSR